MPRFFKRQRLDALAAPDGASVLELVGVPSAVNPVTVTNAATGEGPTISASEALHLVADAVTANGSDVLTPAFIAALSSKSTPVDADILALFDSAASGAPKKLSVADLKAVIVALIVASAPGTLDTLDELAAALGDDANFAATVTALIGTKQPKILTGTVATAAATAAKTVVLDSPWAAYTSASLAAGDMIALTYTSGQSANAATVAVNGGSAVAVRSPAGSSANTWHNIEAGGVLLYRFDGTYLRHQTAISMADITDANIINPASASWGFITGARAEYLMANEATKTRTLAGKTLTSPKITSGNAPATASSTGVTGQVEWDASHIYVCVATNTWVRAALATW